MKEKEKEIKFSRLRRIFKMNGEPAFIVELEENNEKKLYISCFLHDKFHIFMSKEETVFKDEFKKLSKICLMDQCKDGSFMLKSSHITHFEADCSNITIGRKMFYCSDLKYINAKFPSLKNGCCMFSQTKLERLDIDFPKLKNGKHMFSNSNLKSFTGDLTALENGSFMFSGSKLEFFSSNIKKLRKNKKMFYDTSDKLRLRQPYLAV